MFINLGVINGGNYGLTLGNSAYTVLYNPEILEQAGLTMDHVVKTLVFLKDMGDFAAVNGIYSQYFHGEVLPARSCVAVAGLPKGGLVEIEVIAKK